VWGWIKKAGAVYTIYDQTGTYYNPNVIQLDSGGDAQRAFFSFDTSGIADGAVIDLIQFAFKFMTISEPVGFDGTWELSFYYDWNRIGAALSSDDWEFPSIGGTKSWPSTPSTWVKYTANIAKAAVNKDGDTDIEVRCTGDFTDPPGAILWKLIAHRAGPVHHSYLTVGYLMQGVLGKTPSGNMSFLGGMCLATLAKLLMAIGVIPPNSEVDRVEGADIHVVTRFTPRTVMGACS